ncbi:hypothetical protein NQ318_012900 [Aromia moschata]|uniref:non-specific serine/threonine protein kinase n=1 Tax=Aromia moschata TaxID=1265417 RepID=A0AAV8YDB2_9CUCU|nr:hypothetical protein NQ318_012900 [Aromia moschata]
MKELQLHNITTLACRWNFSVGLHDVKLPRISCIDPTSKTFDWNLTAVLPEGKLTASTILNNVEHSWQYQFNSPIVRVWRWTGRNLSEVDLFAPKNIPNILISPILPSIYIGMHNKQLYIHESVSMQEVLHSNINTNIVVAESTSIAKIPWKPIPAAIGAADDESTALSVLNLSEYVNGNGYYLYTETDLNKKDTLLCETNNSVIEPTPDNLMEDMASIYYTTFFCWHRFFIMLATLVVGHFLYRIWIHHHQRQEIIVINKTAEPENTPVERRISENESFTSRFESDFDTVSCLGKGGFGLVFEVKQKYDECNYAIKRITLPKEEKSRDRVMREVKALAKLDHKNIVRYFCSWVEHPPLGWQKDHDQKWIGDTPSLLDGITTTGTAPTYRLEKSRRSKSASVSIDIPMRKLDEKFCLDDDKEDDVDDDSFIVFEPCPNEEDKNTTSAHILDAVEYVHLNGLIHRDLKPSNIFFSLDGQIKVGDFGLVKDMEDAFDLELMKKGSLSPAYRGHTVEVGTKFYMSPEQLESRIYDYKVDIYSLGLIFFELLFPFSTDMERSKTLTDVKNNKFPKNFSNKYPDEYILLQNMLCQDPNKRLTTIGIKARPPFNKKDPNFGEDCHYRLNGVQKT